MNEYVSLNSMPKDLFLKINEYAQNPNILCTKELYNQYHTLVKRPETKYIERIIKMDGEAVIIYFKGISTEKCVYSYIGNYENDNDTNIITVDDFMDDMDYLDIRDIIMTEIKFISTMNMCPEQLNVLNYETRRYTDEDSGVYRRYVLKTATNIKNKKDKDASNNED